MYSCSLALVESASHADLYLWICICVFVFVYFVFVYLCISVFCTCAFESHHWITVHRRSAWVSESCSWSADFYCTSPAFPIQVNFKYFNLTWFVFYLDTFYTCSGGTNIIQYIGSTQQTWILVTLMLFCPLKTQSHCLNGPGLPFWQPALNTRASSDEAKNHIKYK